VTKNGPSLERAHEIVLEFCRESVDEETSFERLGREELRQPGTIQSQHQS